MKLVLFVPLDNLLGKTNCKVSISVTVLGGLAIKINISWHIYALYKSLLVRLGEHLAWFVLR